MINFGYAASASKFCCERFIDSGSPVWWGVHPFIIFWIPVLLVYFLWNQQKVQTSMYRSHAAPLVCYVCPLNMPIHRRAKLTEPARGVCQRLIPSSPLRTCAHSAEHVWGGIAVGQTCSWLTSIEGTWPPLHCGSSWASCYLCPVSQPILPRQIMLWFLHLNSMGNSQSCYWWIVRRILRRGWRGVCHWRRSMAWPRRTERRSIILSKYHTAK